MKQEVSFLEQRGKGERDQGEVRAVARAPVMGSLRVVIRILWISLSARWEAIKELQSQ